MDKVLKATVFLNGDVVDSCLRTGHQALTTVAYVRNLHNRMFGVLPRQLELTEHSAQLLDCGTESKIYTTAFKRQSLSILSVKQSTDLSDDEIRVGFLICRVELVESP